MSFFIGHALVRKDISILYANSASNESEIEQIKTTIDLGIIVNPALNFKDHADLIYVKFKRDIS